MLLKVIVCEVTDVAGFAAAQAGWSALRGRPGFLAQAGGWSDPCTARIVGCWRDRAALRAFMADGHDAIAAGQRDTFRRAEVHHFQVVRAFGKPFPATLATARIIRFAYGPSHPPADADFVRPGHTLAALLAVADDGQPLAVAACSSGDGVPLEPAWTV
ncbi:hypothetical protein ACWT_6210 [Actinoplanes sp. SE50]|uniref:YdbC family protein n=1 Tax=unclassified Actinoplanes TaxID=2626549 RepID=UPI00023ECF41|nr:MULTISPECIES: YdbC family protein [unclassified Actinoplanes]AEV87224.1 ydbC-like uncharacterized protein [Actinoplanes sp. SE50/110]ATO85625.1 hypothetical protein ACWT_6210 [Actinoplanes sp. SE50]SLM03038.1 DUF4937 domain-containing protein [Actinoplanes sp. SE50/110]